MQTARADRQILATDVDRAIYTEFKVAAVREGVTVKQLLDRVIAAYVQQVGKPA